MSLIRGLLSSQSRPISRPKSRDSSCRSLIFQLQATAFPETPTGLEAAFRDDFEIQSVE